LYGQSLGIPGPFVFFLPVSVEGGREITDVEGRGVLYMAVISVIRFPCVSTFSDFCMVNFVISDNYFIIFSPVSVEGGGEATYVEGGGKCK
jgi:hypothetical protein